MADKQRAFLCHRPTAAGLDAMAHHEALTSNAINVVRQGAEFVWSPRKSALPKLTTSKAISPVQVFCADLAERLTSMVGTCEIDADCVWHMAQIFARERGQTLPTWISFFRVLARCSSVTKMVRQGHYKRSLTDKATYTFFVRADLVAAVLAWKRAGRENQA